MNDPDPEIAVVLTAYAAFARGDIDQAIAGLHPRVEWIEPEQFPYGGRRVGPAAVAGYLRDSRSLWAELVSEPAATRRGNDIVVVHRVHGRLADGTFRDVTVADVFTFRNGLIVRMQAYGDPAQALANRTEAAAEVRQPGLIPGTAPQPAGQHLGAGPVAP